MKRDTVYWRLHPLEKKIIISLLNDGVQSHSEIAKYTDVSRGRVSQIARELKLLKNPPDLTRAKNLILDRNKYGTSKKGRTK